MDGLKEKIEVAFLHPRLLLGGAEKVSYDTTLLFNKWGIHSTFFTGLLVKEQFPTCPEAYDIELLPKGKFLSHEQIEFIISKIQERNIKILFLVCNLNVLPTEIQERTGCKLVCWLHSVPFWEVRYKMGHKIAKYRNYPKKVLSPIVNLYLKRKLQTYKEKVLRRYHNNFVGCDAYIVLCEGYKKELMHDLHLDNDASSKIYPILNTLEIKQDVNLKKKKEIIYMGRLAYPDKRVDRIVDIWKLIYQRLPEWTFKIYGVGEEEPFLRKQIKKNHLERIVLAGYAANPAEIYENASILCLTSSYEGIPMAAIEGQNHGVIPVMFNCTFGVQHVVGEEAGILVTPFDLEEYAQKLYELCADSTLQERLRNNCLQKRKEYAFGVNDDIWRNLLNNLLR